MRKVIITGGAGYIGSHTVVELHNSGFIPIIIDNFSNSSIKNIDGISEILKEDIKWYNTDCTNQSKVDRVFEKEHEIIGVIHFAAYKSVEESLRYPKKYHRNNLNSLKTILRSMRKYNVQNIIFSSSCTIYGNPKTLPVSEETPFKKAESPYGETKQICEKILSEENCNSVSLRYFNPIGSHPSSLIGDLSKGNPTNLIPIITEVAIGKRKEIIVFGNNYNTSDGSCIRDYIHVVDLATSHVKAINFLVNNPGKHHFNVGTGRGTSVLEAIELFEQANNINIKYRIGTRRDGDIEKIYSDNTMIMKHLNWTAKKSLKQAMKDAWKWEKSK